MKVVMNDEKRRSISQFNILPKLNRLPRHLYRRPHQSFAILMIHLQTITLRILLSSLCFYKQSLNFWWRVDISKPPLKSKFKDMPTNRCNLSKHLWFFEVVWFGVRII